MSAIVGIFYLDNQPVDHSHLTKMMDILVHRGSDGANIWREENVGFIHRMLWTTPESLLETLPLEKDNLVITADARIDNRDELISALEIRRTNLNLESYNFSSLATPYCTDIISRIRGNFYFIAPTWTYNVNSRAEKRSQIS